MKRKWYLSTIVVAVVVLALSLLGCEGTQGLKGEKGDKGEQGIQGLQGFQGMQGFQGEQGIQGLQGLQGFQGMQGFQGEQGIQGLRGDKGDKGDTGYGGFGIQGIQGVQGVKGDAGVQGIQGVKGDTGDQGIQGIQGERGDAGISAPMLRLVQKDATTWDILNSGTGGLLQYTPQGREFGYVFQGFGLTPNTPYSLIYYADFADRTTNWGGNNPGAEIATGTSNGVGGLYLVGSVDLGIDLPCTPDANISTYDYSGTPDYYANAHGAKIWLVPSSCYDAVDKKVTTWSPNLFLFETDLIYYERQ